MKLKLVKLEIKDNELPATKKLLKTYYLLNPNNKKLEELKHLIEHRNDYMFEDSNNEEILREKKIAENIWDVIESFIEIHFIVLNINDVYEIEY